MDNSYIISEKFKCLFNNLILFIDIINTKKIYRVKYNLKIR